MIVISWTPGCYWPEGAPKNSRVESIVEAYRLLGFEPCDEVGLEDGFEKIAIYGEVGIATHAALQTASGKWTSKLGLDGEDVEHDDLDCISDGVYGRVVQLMRRQRHLAATQPVAHT